MVLYRVVQEFEIRTTGGLGFDWRGRQTFVAGTHDSHKAGDMIELDDGDVEDLVDYLEAVDDEGRAVLERLSATRSEPIS